MYFVDSCNGLLCMRDVYNPFTCLYLELPRLINHPVEGEHIAFGFHPSTKQYKVVQIVYRRQLIRGVGLFDVTTSTLIQSQVHILTIGDPAWRNIGMLPYDLTRPTSKALVNGRLHWLSKPNKNTTASLLASFDLATEQFQEMHKPDCCVLDRCFHDLMVVRGCLSAGAYHDNEQLEIWVMKEYSVKNSWIKEFTIGTYLPRTLQQNDLLHFNNARA
ncbi:F-box protein At3g07870-like [Durio zibethinus]|uniref:F-box protein At3g07870-like n=1 Tax=Durio zibethinus TaxID=66656 RepID=A0A6P6A5R6_DURZI|nr:F-box protein At3g07870-like [Durio zibethinus]